MENGGSMQSENVFIVEAGFDHLLTALDFHAGFLKFANLHLLFINFNRILNVNADIKYYAI